MNGVARISFEGGARLMPAQNQYDRELVFEEAEFFARRHGKATLELNRRALLIRAVGGGSRATCAQCDQQVGPLCFDVGGRLLCRRCVRKSAR